MVSFVRKHNGRIMGFKVLTSHINHIGLPLYLNYCKKILRFMFHMFSLESLLNSNIKNHRIIESCTNILITDTDTDTTDADITKIHTTPSRVLQLVTES